jgi:fatty-acyl-CoA synthase
MAPREWSLADVHEVVAAAAPERDMLVWKSTRRTYAEVAARVRSIARFLARRGVGVRRERDALERWECGQAPVALLLHNCPEYVEAMLGCFRARAVPFNVNQHYRPEEIRSLLDMIAFCERIHRHASGKGDYSWARSVAEKATPAARGPTA